MGLKQKCRQGGRRAHGQSGMACLEPGRGAVLAMSGTNMALLYLGSWSDGDLIAGTNLHQTAAVQSDGGRLFIRLDLAPGEMAILA